MPTVTVTANGQATLNEDLLKHLGMTVGGKIKVDKLPNATITMKAARAEKIGNVFGILADKNTQNTKLSIDETSNLTQDGWATKK